jgi:hypothetical protein
MRQVDLKAAQHLLNPCQATWVRFLYDYGFWELLSSQHMHLLNQKLRRVKLAAAATSVDAAAGGQLVFCHWNTCSMVRAVF